MTADSSPSPQPGISPTEAPALSATRLAAIEANWRHNHDGTDAGRIVIELLDHIATLTAKTSAGSWKCGALSSRTPEPVDCAWPECGCDPVASKVLETLAEQGFGSPNEMRELKAKCDAQAAKLAALTEDNERLRDQVAELKATLGRYPE